MVQLRALGTHDKTLTIQPEDNLQESKRNVVDCRGGDNVQEQDLNVSTADWGLNTVF